MKKNQTIAKNLVLFTLIILVLLVTIGLINQKSKVETEQITFKDQPSTQNQPTIGSPEAKVSIVEFGDFKCPACKAWSERYFPRLKQEYIDSGKVTFSYINATFHGEESKLAALAAESIYAQDPDAYWTFMEEVFKEQPQDNHDASWITSEKLLDIAAAYTPQIDLSKLEEDIRNQTAQSNLLLDEALVQQFNVKQTPTIMINGVALSDPFNFEIMVEIIEEELGK